MLARVHSHVQMFFDTDIVGKGHSDPLTVPTRENSVATNTTSADSVSAKRLRKNSMNVEANTVQMPNRKSFSAQMAVYSKKDDVVLLMSAEDAFVSAYRLNGYFAVEVQEIRR